MPLYNFSGIRRAWTLGRNRPVLYVIAMVVAFLLMSHETIINNSVMLDEYAHLPAGLSYWDLGRFYIYRENPPLVQALVALPAWLTGASLDYSRADPRERSEWSVGVDFAGANRPRYFRYIIRARSVVVIFAIACGALIYRWSGRVYGYSAGLVSAALWFFDPTVMAFSSAITTDVGAAALGCLATYAFWQFIRDHTWKNTFMAGCALGLAECSKFSLLVLYPAWTIVALLARHPGLSQSKEKSSSGFNFWSRFLTILAVSFLILNAMYKFEGTLEPLGVFDFKSQVLNGLPPQGPPSRRIGNRFRDGILGGLRVPLPRDFIMGLDSQKRDEETGFYRISGGRLVRGGSWYSPFVTLSWKLPLGTLILLLSTLVILVRDLRRPTLEMWVVWIPGLSMIALCCGQLGLNWAVRYYLIAFPFLFIGVGRLVETSRRNRWAWLLIIGCLLWNGVAMLGIRPYYLSYGNELIGGPVGAQKVFLGSNTDWGQDLLRLRNWCDEKLPDQTIAIAFYGGSNPASVGIRVRPLPTSFERSADEIGAGTPGQFPETFYWAISSSVLNGLPGAYLLENGSVRLGFVRSPRLAPENAVARIGYTIYVFRIGPTSKRGESRGVITFPDLRGCAYQDPNAAWIASP